MRTPKQAFWDSVLANSTGDQLRLGRAADGRTVPVTPEQRTKGLYLIGLPGAGKTTLFQNLILQDLVAGRGLAFITPEQESITEKILPFIPEQRRADVVYINPADTSRPIPFNPLHVAAGEDLDRRVSQTFAVLRQLFPSEATAAVQMERILRHSLYTLMEIPGTTLLDVERLLDRDDSTYRASAVARISNERSKRFWTGDYPKLPKVAHVSLMNRLEHFLQNKVVRSMLCAPGASFNFRAAMDSGKIILCNMSDAVLHDDAPLVGQLIVVSLQAATLSRANIPEDQRTLFPIYIDEFQTFCSTAAASYEKMLSRARKYRAPLCLAHQQTGQIPDELMDGIFGTVSTLVAFQLGDKSARRLGREMVLDPSVLRSLSVGDCYCRIGHGVAFAMRGDPPPTGGSHQAAGDVIRRSRENYGVSPAAPAGTPPPPSDPVDPAASIRELRASRARKS